MPMLVPGPAKMLTCIEEPSGPAITSAPRARASCSAKESSSRSKISKPRAANHASTSLPFTRLRGERDIGDHGAGLQRGDPYGLAAPQHDHVLVRPGEELERIAMLPRHLLIDDDRHRVESATAQ